MSQNFIKKETEKMKNHKLYFAILFSCIFFSTTAFADVKIKSRQTASGQSNENTTYIKGKRQRSEQNLGEGLQMVNLTQCDLKRSVQMSPLTKTYLINLYNQAIEQNPQNTSSTKDNVVRAGGTITSTVTSKDTGETRKMFGYNARHIITTMETVSSPDACSVMNSKMEIDGWYIDAAFALDCDTNGYVGRYNPQGKSGCQDKYQMKTVGNAKRGYPVYEKMTMFDTNGKESFSTVNEVIELSQATLDASLFEIPADYREVKDTSEMYSASAMTYGSKNTTTMPNGNSSTTTSGISSNIQKQAQSNTNNTSGDVGAKQPGVVRIGIQTKTGAVGEGITAADLAAAIQNTFGEYLKGTKIELIPIEAKITSLVDNEAKQKDCDYVLYANVSHKKGGGGFGGFGKTLGSVVGQTGIGHTGSTAGNIAGQVATQTIVSATTVSANVKSKDEITLDIKLQQPGGAAVLTQQFKAKAKSDDDDIISAVVEKAAQTIVSKLQS
jgi:hypothetical protein